MYIKVHFLLTNDTFRVEAMSCKVILYNEKKTTHTIKRIFGIRFKVFS